MTVEVTRQTEAYKDLGGVAVLNPYNSLSIGNSLSIAVTNNSNINGWGISGLTNYGSVTLGTGINEINVTNTNGQNYINGIYTASGEITGQNLKVSVANEVEYANENANTFALFHEDGVVNVSNLTLEASGKGEVTTALRGQFGNLKADTLTLTAAGNYQGSDCDEQTTGLSTFSYYAYDDYYDEEYEYLVVYELDTQNLIVDVQTEMTPMGTYNGAFGILVQTNFKDDSVAITSKTTSLTVHGVSVHGLYVFDKLYDTRSDPFQIHLGATSLDIQGTQEAFGVNLTGSEASFSTLTGKVCSSGGQANGVVGNQTSLTVTDAVHLTVTSNVTSATGIDFSRGTATFDKTVYMHTQGAKNTYGVTAWNGAQVTFKDAATLITDLIDNPDAQVRGVYTNDVDGSGSKIIFENGLTATTSGKGAYENQAVIFAYGGTVEVNGGAVLSTEADYIALKSEIGGTIRISAENSPTTQIKGDVYAIGDGSNIFVGMAGESSYLTGAIYQKQNAHVGLTLSDNATWNVAAKDNTVGTLGLLSGTLAIDSENTTISADDLELVGKNTMTVKDAPATDYYLAAKSVTKKDGTFDIEGTSDYMDNQTSVDEAVKVLWYSAIDSNKESFVDSIYLPESKLYGDIFVTRNADGSYRIDERANSKLDALNSINVLSAMPWKHEINDLNERMGQLRDSPAGIGTWARIYGSEMEHGDQNVLAKNTTLQVGSDVAVGDWKFGIAANYTDGEATYDNGQADTKNYGIALYGSWLAPCGGYVDLIAKYSRLDNDFALRDMKGSYDNNAFSLSAETGYRFNFVEDSLFVEPQVELTYGYVAGDTFTTSNDVTIDQDGYYSFMGRLGVRTGFTFPNKKGTVFAKVSVVHDFAGDMESSATTGGSIVKMKDDIGGTSVEYGVGANFAWTDNTYSYLSLERSSGGDVDERYRFNVGLRHVF